MYIFGLLLLVTHVFANTEIVNFSAERATSLDLPFTQFWPVLTSKVSTVRWNITSAPSPSSVSQELCPNLALGSFDKPHICPHELWVVLETDKVEWQNFDKFTLRLSWPAYYPADISIRIYEPSSLAILSKKGQDTQLQLTRRKYARIQAIYTGVLSPGRSHSLGPLGSTSYQNVPIILTLEPLYFGLLPGSVVPIVATVIAIIALGYPAASKIHTRLQNTVKLSGSTLCKVD